MSSPSSWRSWRSPWGRSGRGCFSSPAPAAPSHNHPHSSHLHKTASKASFSGDYIGILSGLFERCVHRPRPRVWRDWRHPSSGACVWSHWLWFWSRWRVPPSSVCPASWPVCRVVGVGVGVSAHWAGFCKIWSALSLATDCTLCNLYSEDQVSSNNMNAELGRSAEPALGHKQRSEDWSSKDVLHHILFRYLENIKVQNRYISYTQFYKRTITRWTLERLERDDLIRLVIKAKHVNTIKQKQ